MILHLPRNTHFSVAVVVRHRPLSQRFSSLSPSESFPSAFLALLSRSFLHKRMHLAHFLNDIYPLSPSGALLQGHGWAHIRLPSTRWWSSQESTTNCFVVLTFTKIKKHFFYSFVEFGWCMEMSGTHRGCVPGNGHEKEWLHQVNKHRLVLDVPSTPGHFLSLVLHAPHIHTFRTPEFASTQAWWRKCLLFRNSIHFQSQYPQEIQDQWRATHTLFTLLLPASNIQRHNFQCQNCLLFWQH